MHDFEDGIDSEFVFEATTDAMAIVDAAADRTDIVAVNSAFERRFGCEEPDIRGARLSAIVGTADGVRLQSRIRPGVEMETTVNLDGCDGESVLRVRPFDAERSDTRSLLVITGVPNGDPAAAPGVEDWTAGDSIRPVVEIARAEDIPTVRDATGALLLDGLGFDAAVVDLGEAEPLAANVDGRIAVPRSNDDTPGVTEHDVKDDRNDERWGVVASRPVDEWGVIQVAAHTAAATDHRVTEGVELVCEYVGTVLDRLDRERRLRTESEEMAVLNRVLRHEVLNGLTLVRARLGLLEQDVSRPNREHYETARVRIENMIDRVEAVREIGREDGTADTEPFSLVDVVRGQVERADEHYPEASFSIVGTVPDVEVAVDDLVHFCLDNVLRNSVQHADIDDPAVRVDVQRANGVAAIRITDNGPGIPDDLGRSVFERGVSSLDDESHGEGLFLTERIVDDIYGGAISVGESDRGGAEFAIELPVADG